VTFEHDDFPNEIDVTTCSLDNPELAAPQDHTHTNSKLGWIDLCDGLLEYPESRQRE